MSRTKIARCVASACSGVIALAPGCSDSILSPRAFEAADWRDMSSDDRGCMVADLLASGRLAYGMQRDAVVELLGPPDYEWEFLVYWLGPVPGDGGRLTVNLEAGRVASFARDALPMDNRPSPCPFDRDAWLARTADARLAMLGAVLSQEESFRGRSPDDVEQAFGWADEREHLVTYAVGETTTCWIGCPMTPELTIHFDSLGSLVAAYEYTSH